MLFRSGPELDRISLQIENRVEGLQVPRGSEPVWAAEALFARPDAADAALRGLLAGAQIRARLRAATRDFATPGRASSGAVMSAVGADGARTSLDEKLIEVTGSDLDHTPLLRELNAAP